MASPTSSSAAPSPYISAVSISVRPRSRPRRSAGDLPGAPAAVAGHLPGALAEGGHGFARGQGDGLHGALPVDGGGSDCRRTGRGRKRFERWTPCPAGDSRTSVRRPAAAHALIRLRECRQRADSRNNPMRFCVTSRPPGELGDGRQPRPTATARSRRRSGLNRSTMSKIDPPHPPVLTGRARVYRTK